MESDTIKDSIENLIKARPSVTTASTSDYSSVLTKSVDTLWNVENRHSSMKRKSMALPVAKCNCGKCLKCVPSPSGKRAPSRIVLFFNLGCYFFVQIGCGMVESLFKLVRSGKCRTRLAVSSQLCVV